MSSKAELISGFTALALAVSCGFGPLDVLGVEAIVTELEKSASEPEDDRIEDKHPEYDPDRVITETFGEFCDIELNKSATVTKLDIVPFEDENSDLEDRVFPSRGSAISELNKRAHRELSLIPSMEVVNGALKPFNDGMYASIELAVQEGLESEGEVVLPSKRAFLHDLLDGVLASGATADPDGMASIHAAAVELGAALLLAQEQPVLPQDLLAQAQAAAADFENNPLYSRPIGFYTWDTVLEQIFRQDRFLQNYQLDYPEASDPYSDEEIAKAAALALAIQADPELEAKYQRYLALYKGLTNPFMDYAVTDLLPYISGMDSLDDPQSVRDAFLRDQPQRAPFYQCQPHFAIFPASRSKESTYFEEQFCGPGAPSDLNYLDELIRAIREGLIDLKPTEDSGWYDYQSWALETLLLPERGQESNHLLLTKSYKKKLQETFKTIIIQNRETHAKQLGMSYSRVGLDMEVDLYPLLPVEPFPTFYLRSARAYRFLSVYLASVLGLDFLAQTHRMFEDGTRAETSLKEELNQKGELLYGLHILSADAVGMKPELLPEELSEFGEAACREQATAWLQHWRADRDVLSDPRVMVPVHRDGDGDTEETVYWATLGVKAIKAHAEFVKGHEPRDISGCWTGEFVPHDYFLMVEVSAQIRRPMNAPPPTRDELRGICDSHGNIDDMVAALENP